MGRIGNTVRHDKRNKGGGGKNRTNPSPSKGNRGGATKPNPRQKNEATQAASGTPRPSDRPSHSETPGALECVDEVPGEGNFLAVGGTF